MESRKLFDFLNEQLLEQQNFIKEATEDGPFPIADLNQEEGQEVDPTETPQEEMSNRGDVIITSPKLAMLADLILKAYMAKPDGQVPENLQNATPENANEIIKFIEDKLAMTSSSDNIADDLSKL